MFKKRDLPTTYSKEQFIEAIQVRPKVLLRTNSKLRKTKTWVFTLPALQAMVLKDGELELLTTCKSAGDCAGFCFAQMGTYQFKNSIIAHHRNLQYVLDNPFGFVDDMVNEIKNKKNVPTIRIHDAGDFFNKAYRDMWFLIAKECPEASFYIYTKEVKMFKQAQADNGVPANFQIVYSLGGKQDHLIDIDVDRHSRVFRTEEECYAAGYELSSNDDANAANPLIQKLGLVFHSPLSGNKAIAKVKKLETVK